MSKHKRKISGVIDLISQSQDQDQSMNNAEISKAGKLALIGAAISTFGDALQTFAAALALEEAYASDVSAALDKSNQDKKMADMQKQIDELTLQIKRLSKS